MRVGADGIPGDALINEFTRANVHPQVAIILLQEDGPIIRREGVKGSAEGHPVNHVIVPRGEPPERHRETHSPYWRSHGEP